MFKKISIKSLLNRKKYSKEEERKAIDNEKILGDSLELTDLEKEILRLNKSFNLVSFFHGDSEVETGVGVITPYQSLCVECKLAESDDHGYNFQVLYDTIYDNKVSVLPVDRFMGSWQTIAMADGNIAIQLTGYGDCYIWCPSVINDFQLKILQDLNEKLKELDILISEDDSFKHKMMDVYCCVRMEDGEEISIDLDDNNIDFLLDNYHYDSFMGEASFNDFRKKEEFSEKKNSI